MIKVIKIPTKIPVIKLVAIVVNKVTKKIINCSFPTLKTFLIFSGEANLYPVKTNIAAKAGKGILRNSVANNKINANKKPA